MIGYRRLKVNVECNSNDVWYGKKDTPMGCATACAAAGDCVFFIFGTNGTKLGDCYRENTQSPTCAEGWEADTFDFYALEADHVGCTEPRAVNYNAHNSLDDGTCEEWSPCVEKDKTSCQEWRHSPKQCHKPCSSGSEGYRNRDFDMVDAHRVLPGAVTVDGDLREWGAVPQRSKARGPWYTDVAFANAAGDEVSFESSSTHTGKWYGPDDFSVSWSLRWDDFYFYVAADVTDDTFKVGERTRQNADLRYCYKTGLQLGFEVGGPDQGDGQGVLQARPITPRPRSARDYEEEYYFWEVIEMIRKFLLCGGLRYVAPGKPSQVIFGLIFCILYMSAVGFFSP